MIKTCPCCNKTYKTKLDRYNDEPIQNQFPKAKEWEREQLISGLCSNKCWNKFLGVR